MLRKKVRSGFRSVPGFESFWGTIRSTQLHHQYKIRREYYAGICQQKKIIYDEDDVINKIRIRLSGRGYTPSSKKLGDIHTFAFIPRRGWHSALYEDLYELGSVSEFNYSDFGYSIDEFRRFDSIAARKRREMNALSLDSIREANAKQPIDWIFIYATGLEIQTEFLAAIKDEFGIPIVNMCLDDKQSWTGPTLDGQTSGQIAIAPHFDLSWTSARVACEWYLCEGGLPVYMPEGFDKKYYRPLNLEQDIPVSFIGGAYGFRPSVIRLLKKANIPIDVFGPGWGTKAVWGEEQIEIINRSRINLGLGGIGYSEDLTNVKTRDFEIPGTGGGLYLTSFNPDLAQHYDVGNEIICYRNRDEMIELIRYYLARPDLVRAVVERGRARCLSEHRWLHRYKRVCQILGILNVDENDPSDKH
jgi:spore maturation protein CgeB